MKFALKMCLLAGTAALLFGCKSELPGEEESELNEDGMEQAMRQEFLMTHDPNTNTIPAERLAIARSYTDALLANNRLSSITWQERGPNNIGGRTRAILVDRSDATGNTVLAASVSGGIFRTTSFLTTPNWTPVADNMLNLAVTCLLQDKTNPAVMYAGTGEGWFNIDAVRGAGVFKSTNGGVTWTQISGTSAFEYVQDIEQDLNGNLYVSLRNQNTTNRGVMRSTDGGANWTQVLGAPLAGFATGRAADLEVASNGDIYATLGIFTRSVVMKSAATNGANTGAVGTWTDITPVHTAITERAEIAVAPSNPQRVYLAMVDSISSKVISVYRSSNAGAAWDSLGAPDAIVNNGAVSQNWYNLILQVSPTNPDMVLIGGFHVGRSLDAGATWNNITSAAGVHVDQHQIAFLGSNSKIIVGNDGGLYYSADADGVSPSFTNKNGGYNVTQFYAADFHPTNTNYFLAGAQDNNTQKFTSAGVNATTAVVGGDGGFCHIRQTDGQLQIAATTGNNYYRSTNGGASWGSLGSGVNNNRGQFINATDLDDAQNVLYCGDAGGKYYFVSGLDASPLGTQVTLAELGSNRIVTAVKVDPFSTNTVWLGTSSTGVAVMPVVIKVNNANTTSPLANAYTLPSAAGASVSSIDVDPNNANHILVTLSNYGTTNIFETTNGGVNWTDIDGNLPDMPVRWGLIVPGHASVNGTNAGGLMIATELGVWYSTGGNGGATTWTPLNTGFPNVRTDMIKYRATDRTVVVATHGRGLFTGQITAITTGINPTTLTKDFIKYSSANNDQLLIVPGSLNVQKMQIEILDINGRLVYRSSNAYRTTSVYTGNLSKGIYVLRVFGDKKEYYAQQFMR
jgi:photosystem II stability/assembly factor-like uncharacterized protein